MECCRVLTTSKVLPTLLAGLCTNLKHGLLTLYDSYYLVDQSGQLAVLSALWSDGVSDGSGTMLRIHDPWPVNRGSIYARFYRGTIAGTTPYGTQFDFLTMYILEPR